MPVPAKHFYSRCSASGRSEGSNDSESTEKRWPSPRLKSDIEVPPSDFDCTISEPLSAPLSGFSQPKTSSCGLKPPSRPNNARMVRTRFTRALMLVQDRWEQAGFPTAKQVLSVNSVNRSSEDLSAAAALISLPNSTDKCNAWVQSISESNQPAHSHHATNTKRLVDYSPSSNSTCSSNLSKLGKRPHPSNSVMKIDFDEGKQPTATLPAPRAVMRRLNFGEGKEKNMTKLATSTATLPGPRALSVGLPRPKANAQKSLVPQSQPPANSSENCPPLSTSVKRKRLDSQGTCLPVARAVLGSVGQLRPLPQSKTAVSKSCLEHKSDSDKYVSSSKISNKKSIVTASSSEHPLRNTTIITYKPASDDIDASESLSGALTAVSGSAGQLSPLTQSKTAVSKACLEQNSDSNEYVSPPKISKKQSIVTPSSSVRPVRKTTGVTYRPASDDSDASERLFGGSDDDDRDPSWVVGNFGQNSDFTYTHEEDDCSDKNRDSEDETSSPRGSTGFAELEQMSDEQSSPPPKITKKQLRATRKLKRNSGQSYVTEDGALIQARQRTAVHKCVRLKCRDIITDEIGDAIFSEYWAMSSYEKRVNYICSRVETQRIQRSRRRLPVSNRGKTFSNRYFFDINGCRHQVCKSAFLDTLGETDTFLRICVMKKSETTTGIGPNERRGKQTPKHALTEDVKNKVLEHIKSYPAYVSHYCRKQTKQKYLSCELTLKKMLDQFNEENNHLQLKVSYSTYRRIFKPLKLKFKEPATDTCAKCDEFRAKLKFVKSEEMKKALETKYELHLRKAEAAYALKTHYTKLAKTDKNIKVLIFDLEQVFATPNVTCGMAYYLRQLSTFNLTIVDAGTGNTFNCMWHEGEAARGASQIASCIFNHIMNEVKDNTVELFLFSDCCSGQNRNSLVATMFHILLCLHASLKVVNHIFLVPGHTRLECDSKHSVIERKKQHAGMISIPSQWYEVVDNVGDSFKVVEMADKFFDFAPVLEKTGPLIMRDKLDNGQKMYWTKTHFFQYQASKPGIINVKPNFSEDSEFNSYSMVRGMSKNRKLPNQWWNSLATAPPGNCISQEKKDNLMSLLPFIDECYHEFYQSLKVDGAITEDTDPDLPSDNEESDED